MTFLQSFRERTITRPFDIPNEKSLFPRSLDSCHAIVLCWPPVTWNCQSTYTNSFKHIST
jgi:hypothetical protein